MEWINLPAVGILKTKLSYILWILHRLGIYKSVSWEQTLVLNIKLIQQNHCINKGTLWFDSENLSGAWSKSIDTVLHQEGVSDLVSGIKLSVPRWPRSLRNVDTVNVLEDNTGYWKVTKQSETDKMAIILQITHLSACSWMTFTVFWFPLHCIPFPRVWLAKCHHWFR